MGTEKISRLHYGNNFEESPAAMPLAVNAAQAKISQRRMHIRDTTDVVLGKINEAFSLDAPNDPPANPPTREKGHEILEQQPAITRVIGASALDATTLDRVLRQSDSLLLDAPESK